VNEISGAITPVMSLFEWNYMSIAEFCRHFPSKSQETRCDIYLCTSDD